MYPTYSGRIGGYLLFVLLIATQVILAQTNLNADGKIYARVGDEQTYTDYLIPEDLTDGDYEIRFALRGGGGGGADAGNNCTAKGGDGAYVTLRFRIGNADDELRPGGLLRFIPGDNGTAYFSDVTLGRIGRGNAGGGSGLLYTYSDQPNDLPSIPSTDFSDAADHWVILAVAGGGGGAFRRYYTGICWSAKHGQGGRSSESGGNGSGSNNNGGTNGNGGGLGNEEDVSGLPGGGVFSGGEEHNGISAAAGGITGGFGYTIDDTPGGFGYGAGGRYFNEGGGGGGGFSGGGGGGDAIDERGGGGGSFVSSAAYATQIISGGNTNFGSAPGYVSYQLGPVGPPTAVCASNVRFDVLIADTSPSLDATLVDGGSFDPGVEDITLSLSPDECDEFGAGWQSATLTVTDDSGNQDSCQTNIFVSPQAPTGVNALDLSDVGFDSVGYSGTYKDYVIPYAGANTQVSFTLNGGDGGYAYTGTTNGCANCRSRGGYGARTEATFTVGCAANELLPGSLLRLVVGGSGTSGVYTGASCIGSITGGGGGGTALLYKPFGCAEWEILAVAGGGGGAYQGTAIACGVGKNGRDGATNVNGNGSDGNGSSFADGGTGGLGGGSGIFSGGGGGGAFSDGGAIFCALSEYGGGQAGGLSGGAGGAADDCGGGHRDGGYGFGGGGASISSVGGGGGGGYSGGGGGGTEGAGGGGGSYVNLAYATDYAVTTESYTDEPAPGYAKMQAVSSDNLLPVVTPRCQENLTVALDENGDGLLYPSQLDDGSTTNDCGTGNLTFWIQNSPQPLVYNCDDLGTRTVQLGVLPFGVENIAYCNTLVTVVDDQAPKLTCTDLVLQLPGSGNLNVLAEEIRTGVTENCSSPTYTLSKSNFDCDDIGATNVTLTATDASGNSGSCTVAVTIVENDDPYVCCSAPVAVCQDTTIAIGSGFSLMTPEILDAGTTAECTITEYTFSRDTFYCTDVGTYEVFMFVTDVKGNSDVCAANVTVTNPGSVSALCRDIDVQLEEDLSVVITAEQVDNGSGVGGCQSAQLSLSRTFFTCFNVERENVVTLTAEAEDGTTATCTAQVRVLPFHEPTARCHGAITRYLGDGGEDVVLTGADLDRNSSTWCDNELIMTPEWTVFSCSEIGTHTVNLFVTDLYGGADTCSTQVTIQDTSPPIVSCRDTTVALADDGQITLATATLTADSYDGCGGALSRQPATITFSESELGDQSVTVTLTDPSGNQDSCSLTVTVLPVGALPLALLSFTGHAAAKHNLLRWATTDEESFSHFVVERSPDGRSWQALGEVSGSGVNGREQDYHFYDQTPPARTYYRLRMVDWNGDYSHSSIVRLVRTVEFSVYPNPNDGAFTVTLPEGENPWFLAIYSIQGTHVHAQKVTMGTPTVTLTEKLPPGVYLVVAESVSGRWTRRMVVR